MLVYRLREAFKVEWVKKYTREGGMEGYLETFISSSSSSSSNINMMMIHEDGLKINSRNEDFEKKKVQF